MNLSITNNVKNGFGILSKEKEMHSIIFTAKENGTVYLIAKIRNVIYKDDVIENQHMNNFVWFIDSQIYSGKSKKVNEIAAPQG